MTLVFNLLEGAERYSLSSPMTSTMPRSRRNLRPKRLSSRGCSGMGAGA